MSSEPPPPPDPDWAEKEAQRLVDFEAGVRARFVAFAKSKGKTVEFVHSAKTKEEWMRDLKSNED